MWRCSCGCFTHIFLPEGLLECAHCGEVQNCEEAGEFVRYLPPPADPAPESRNGDFKIIDMGTSDAAFRRLTKLAVERQEQVVLFLLLYANGTQSNYRSSADEEQIEWLIRRLDEYKEDLHEEVRARKAAKEAGAKAS